MPPDEPFPGHPCMTRDCGHPETAHVATPELATYPEVVVWCADCRRHEVHRPRRFRLPWSRGESPRLRGRLSRPS